MAKIKSIIIYFMEMILKKESNLVFDEKIKNRLKLCTITMILK